MTFSTSVRPSVRHQDENNRHFVLTALEHQELTHFQGPLLHSFLQQLSKSVDETTSSSSYCNNIIERDKHGPSDLTTSTSSRRRLVLPQSADRPTYEDDRVHDGVSATRSGTRQYLCSLFNTHYILFDGIFIKVHLWTGTVY